MAEKQTDYKAVIAALEAETEKYAMAMAASEDLIFEHDLDNDTSMLYYFSETTRSLEALPLENHSEHMLDEMLFPSDRKVFSERMYDDKEKVITARMMFPTDTDYHWYRMSRRFEYHDDGTVKRICGVVANIDEEKQKENEMKRKIEMDPVLNIYNRNAAVAKINEYLANNTDRRDYALLVMDIDDFKNVNDSYGHLYGDAVIAMAAEILNNAAEGVGIAGRYGGDEFFLFLEAMTREEICRKADEVTDGIKDFYVADGKNITCSIGVAIGDSFEQPPTYKDLFDKADKALYHVKNNGKAAWKEYGNAMAQGGHAIDYEAEERVATAELLDTRDIMKVFLELSAGAKTSDAAIYEIIRYVADKFDIEWMQIMQVNCKEDLVTIKYEWCSDPNFRNNAGRSGYYVHSDLMLFRNHFENNPVFVICPENTEGFSMKFQREFEKNMVNSVIYNANVTKDDLFYMFVCTRFGKDKPWDENETLELNTVTKIMTMYVSQADKETENERRYKRLVDIEKKTGLYNPEKFWEQLGRLRKNAAENGDRVILAHIDFDDIFEFTLKYGNDDTDAMIKAYADRINTADRPEFEISSHIGGTDIFLHARRIPENDLSVIKEIDELNKSFCTEMTEKYPDARIILRAGFYMLEPNDIGGDGLNNAILAKRAVKDYDESFAVLYKN